MRLGLCVFNEPLYVLGAGQHELRRRDNSRDCCLTNADGVTEA